MRHAHARKHARLCVPPLPAAAAAPTAQQLLIFNAPLVLPTDWLDDEPLVSWAPAEGVKQALYVYDVM